ncbi:unnamed protein product [Schistosoma rodhaini]|uniref:Uncharacterized protein n=1 Tax=Schistosoma rodhaini TaxID=6188 RepID=A0AA85G818_9TREM|nr:unnamed protein product [Schistosoma rodhaini]
MFMKSSFLRQFRKEETALHPVGFSEPSQIDSKKPSSLIWKGLEDGNASSTCDLDDDDYFESDHFMSSNEANLSTPSKTNWNDNKWSKMLKFGDESKKRDLVPFTPESPKISNLRNTSQKFHVNKTIISPDNFDQARPQSPIDDLGVPKKAPESPMLNFLSKKPSASFMQSPDAHNVSTSSEDSVYFHRASKVCQDYTGEAKTHLDKVHDKPVTEFSVEDKSDTLCDNLKFLYKRLRQEAENLETWKCCTMSKLEEKCLDLQSYESLVENLRRANLELQMNMETVSLKYKDELAVREKLSEQFSTIKQQCTTLELKAEKLMEANLIIASKFCQSEIVNNSLLSIFKTIKDNLIEQSNKCLDKFKESEKLVTGKILDLETLQESYIVMDEKNKLLQDELLHWRQKHHSDVIQLQTEIDQLSTENIELKELEKTLMCTNEKNLSLIKRLQDAIAKEKINGENAEQMLKNNSKENDELRDLVTQIRDKNLYVLEMFNTLNKKFILLENQTTTLRSHFKCFTNKIGNMIAKLNSFQVQQENSKEEMVIDLKDKQQNIKKLAQKIDERSIVIHKFESSLYQTCVNLVMESEILKIDRENLVNLNRKVFELEKEIEFYHMSENALRDALKKCQTQNEKLQIINDSLHTQLNCESRNCTKANENYLKAEALVKHLEEIARSNQNEMKDLTEKARAIEKELKEERHNSSKVKETLEFHEKKFYELKMSSEKNQQALDLARMQIKEKEEHHEELKRQLVNLNQEKEKSILKQIQLTNNINDVTIQLEYSRQEIGQQKLREKLIQEQNQRLENEKTELQKQNESITDELLSLKERLNQQADEIKQKQDEVESLKGIIDLKNIESSKSRRKVDKKLNESMNLIQKLREQTKELSQEKKEILKKHMIKEQELKKLEVKAINQEKELIEANDEKQRLYEELKRMKQDQIERETILAENNRELLKLRSIEKEYQEFQHQIYANSPPVSTQLPKEIHEKVTQTPKSPALSLKLDNLNMTETPTKTPKSILKQPGSATKRRRVFFASPDYESMVNNEEEPGYQKQEFEFPLFRKVSPSTMNTPKIQNLQTLDKVTNIRKTPRKTGRQITEECYKMDTEKSWFDCEQIFGYGAED